MACLLLGVSIWMGVDRNFMTFIIGNHLYAAAVFIVLGCGGIIFFISFLGCCGVVLDKSRMLVVVSSVALLGKKSSAVNCIVVSNNFCSIRCANRCKII
jgi:hypothetical protein